MITRKSKNKFIVTIKYHDKTEHRDVISWCEQMFGPGGRNKKCSWRYGQLDYRFFFKKKQDAILFSLRWA